MEQQAAWEVLGLEPTSDIDAIKNRYHELLTQANPEDDMEGFMRLREAYEAVTQPSAYSSESKPEQEGKPKDDIDMWLERVDQTYWYADTRNNPELWQELLDDPLCMALDTALDVRERFLVWMMSHFYLKQSIYQLIDKTFHIIGEQEELEEKFPKDFLSYLRLGIENKEFFNYDLLEVRGADESEIPIDSYLYVYFDVKRAIDREDYESAGKALEELDTFAIYHPYADVERLRLYLHEEKTDAAVQLAERLEEPYAGDTYIDFWMGKACFSAEMWEQGYACFQRIQEMYPNHYGSKLELANYYLKRNDCLKAKDLIMELLEAGSTDDALQELLLKVNEKLIPYYDAEARKDAEEESLPDGTPRNKKNAVEACWCVFQTERFQETLERLDALKIQPDMPEWYDYVNMKSRCYWALEDYENALDYLFKWNEARKNLPDDGSEEYRKRQKREGMILHTIGRVYQHLGNKEEAERYYRACIACEGNMPQQNSAWDSISQLYYEAGRYEECREICTHILEQDSYYYPAYLRRQQAAYQLRDGQQVVDDYYNAVHVYRGYYRPYLLAVRVFLRYGQAEDAKKVLEAAKEADVAHPTLQFCEVSVLRKLASSPEDTKAALQLCRELRQKLQNTEQESEPAAADSPETRLEQSIREDGFEEEQIDLNELAMEEVLMYMDLEELGDARELIEEEIKRGNQDIRLRWVRADIDRRKERYQKALEEYEQLLREMPDNSRIMCNRGLCLRELGRDEEAIRSYQEALKIEPDHPTANHQIMRIYSRWYDKYELKTAYGKALRAINEQLKVDADAYYYIERGLLYMDNYNLEQALADYQKALEQEPENIYAWNNIGYVYRVQGRYAEAIDCFQKSIEYMNGEEETKLAYTNLAGCYRALHRYPEAIEILQKAGERFGWNRTLYEDVGKCYLALGDYQKAQKLYQEGLDKKVIDRYDYCEYMMHCCEISGDWKRIKPIYAQWIRNTNEKNLRLYRSECCEAAETLGRHYLFRRELRQAIHYLEYAYEQQKKNKLSTLECERRLAMAYRLQGKKKKAAEYARQGLWNLIHSNHIPENLKRMEAEDPETEEAFLSYRPLAPMRLDEVAQLHMCMGDLELAERCLLHAREIPKCRNCAYSECYDALISLAYLEELRGNIPKAVRILERAVRINPHDEEVVLSLKALKQHR